MPDTDSEDDAGWCEDDNATLPKRRFSVEPAGAGWRRARDRVQESLAVLTALSMGELLAALPADDSAHKRHQTAVSLLSVVERLLKDALVELDD